MMKSVDKSVYLFLGGAVASLVLGGCGHDDKPRQAPTHSERSAAQRRDDVARQWKRSGSFASHDPASATPRERLANQIVSDPEILADDASTQVVEDLLGPPLSKTSNTWRYLAARWQPAQGYGEPCVRYFSIRFDASGEVVGESLEPPRCPPGVNP